LHKKGQIAKTIVERFVLDAGDRVAGVEETGDGTLVRPESGFRALVAEVWSGGDSGAYVISNTDVTPRPAPIGVGRAGGELFGIDDAVAFRAFERAAKPAPMDLARLLVRFQHAGEPQELVESLKSIGRMLVRREVRRVPGFRLPLVEGGAGFKMVFCTFRVPWPHEKTGTLYAWHLSREPDGDLAWTRKVLATGLTSPMFAQR
jgi:hypothetical protein